MKWIVGILVLPIVAWLVHRRMLRFAAGMNAVLGAATYRTLSREVRAKVDAKLVEMCIDNQLDPEQMTTSPMPNVVPYPSAAVWAFRAEAMKIFDIPPADTAYPHWMLVRNPFLAILAGGQMKTSRAIVERHLDINLSELD
jgi:hypothetical protein